MPVAAPIATPEAKACSSGVQPLNRREEAIAPIIPIFLIFFFNIIKFLHPFTDTIVYKKSEEIVFRYPL